MSAGPAPRVGLATLVAAAGADELIEAIDTDTGTEVGVVDLTLDSRAVRPGMLFACLRGEHDDGHAFAADAVAAGAVALLVERRLDLPVAQLVVRDARRALGPVAAACFAHPSRLLDVVGITGTSGKTTTANVLTAVLRHAGWPTDVYGTMSGVRTTPEAPELQRQLAASLASRRRAVVTEVSSHALELRRVDGTRFRVAVFTNLGRDHLDLHGSVEAYFRAKARLFTPELADAAVVNADDTHGRLLLDAAEIPTVAYSLADASAVEIGATATRYRWRDHEVHLALGGEFNVSNSLAAATAASMLGVDDATIAGGLGAAEPVRGRFEAVDAGQDFTVIVDYSHKPDALDSVLRTAREVAPGRRVLVTFGCGGDRDPSKRPEMGRIAAERADLVVVTSDNPRSEDPLAIIASIVAGVADRYRERVSVEPDRRAAIAAVLRAARTGDIVIIAGKGHETTQTIGSEVLPFDDRAVALELLEERS
jgi:UDP-N-acetylmuramoyl-L-alanyl-D-glutamate--2,6-diaminopimelate ligase